jgi:histidine ammonia-lyase
MSHAVALGEPYSEQVVRAGMILRLNNLVKGYSGADPETVILLKEFINRGIHPVVPRKGSLGASGDLAPLAHIALVLMGLGKAEYKGEILDGQEALKRAGLKPVQLKAKEGLALINGTQIISAVACLMIHKARKMLKMADLIGACSLEALKGTFRAFDPKVGLVRAHSGQIESAKRLTAFGRDSMIRQSHINCSNVQDAYTLRCMPQVHGAVGDVIEFAAKTLETEINSVTDNPLIFCDEDQVISAGNFHGQPIAFALDFLAISISELASISERRIERLVNPEHSRLPAFLVESGGLNSGFMIVQYTAAHLVSENKVLAHPASVDSIPTSANKEDHVSMAGVAANKLLTVADNVEKVLSLEALCAVQALDFHKPLISGPAIEAFRAAVREKIAFLDKDRVMTGDLEAILQIVSEFDVDKYIPN